MLKTNDNIVIPADQLLFSVSKQIFPLDPTLGWKIVDIKYTCGGLNGYSLPILIESL